MFPYVDQSLFELRVQYAPEDFGLIQLNANGQPEPTAEWGTLVESILEEESERVEGVEYANDEWRDADATVPPAVRSAVIALAQNALAQVKERGLDKESLGSGASGSGGSYSYTPQETLRAIVKQDLADAGYGTHNVPSAKATGRPTRGW